jgi:uncharacterized protein (UPF0264 family)
MKFLATVVSGAEAKIIADLVDLLDVKDPSTGAMGAPGYAAVRGVRSVIGGQSPLSVALGDVDADNVLAVVELARLMAGGGATMVKVGLSKINQDTALGVLIDLKKAMPKNILVSAVAYADGDRMGFFPAFALPGVARDAGIDGIMLDTFTKGDGKSLLDHLSPEFIQSIIGEAKKLGLKTALAGSLDIKHIDPIAQINPDWIGFRGAITMDGIRQTSGVDRAKANKIKTHIKLAMKNVAKQISEG